MTLLALCTITEIAKAATLGLPEPLSTTSRSNERAAIALGKELFFDTRLSGDGTISCATCHQPEKAFTDGRAVARGIASRTGTRNTPSLLNVSLMTSLFWDGRRAALEQLPRDPLLNPREHGAQLPLVLDTIRADTRYRTQFREAFGVSAEAIELGHVERALAAFQRTLRSGDSPFDRHLYGGSRDALNASALRGLALFRGRAQCASCHVIGERDALLTDQDFHSLGVGLEPIMRSLPELTTRVAGMTPSELDRAISDDPKVSALGRFLVTKDPKDIGKFKTPSLRNVALTAPYMHDGSVATLSEAVESELYYRSLESGRPLILTPTEKNDLVAFLQGLTTRQE